MPLIEIDVLEQERQSWTAPVLGVQLFYGLIMFVVEFYLAVFLGVTKKYVYSFYRLVQLDLTTNLLCCANSWISIRCEILPYCVPLLETMEDLRPGLVTYLKIAAFWFLHMQFLTAISMQIHRWISVCHPTRLIWFDTILDKQWVAYALYGSFLALVSTGLTLLVLQPTLEVYNVNHRLHIRIHSENMMIYSYLIVGFSVAYFLILFVFGLYARKAISDRVKKLSSSDRGVSAKMNKITVASCIAYMGILIWSVLRFINHQFKLIQMTTYTENIFLGFCSDVMTFSLPIILLWIDGNLRKDIISRWRKPNVVREQAQTIM